MKEDENQQQAFVELPTGIFTAEGVWFHTRRELLEEFARDVIERVSLEELLQRATIWLQLPVTVTVLVVPAYLLVVDPLPAALAGLVTWACLALLSPSIVFPSMMNVIGRLSHPIVQGLLYVIVLSFLAARDEMAGVAVGIAAFILLRWGLMDRVLRPALQKLPTPGPDLPVPDQILRNLILRYGLKFGIDLPELATMEDRMLDIFHRHRSE